MWLNRIALHFNNIINKQTVETMNNPASSLFSIWLFGSSAAYQCFFQAPTHEYYV